MKPDCGECVFSDECWFPYDGDLVCDYYDENGKTGKCKDANTDAKPCTRFKARGENDAANQ